jgi:hypothetical protein
MSRTVYTGLEIHREDIDAFATPPSGGGNMGMNTTAA